MEAVDPFDVRRFVIAAEKEEIVRILNLVYQQKTDTFERLFAAVNMVAEEEVVCFQRKATVFEQLPEVIVLPVDVALGAISFVKLVVVHQGHGLIYEDLTKLCTQVLDLALLEVP